MQKHEMDEKILKLLYAEHYAEAAYNFKLTCSKENCCINVLDCIQSCIIPRLRHTTLSNDNKKLEELITVLLSYN